MDVKNFLQTVTTKVVAAAVTSSGPPDASTCDQEQPPPRIPTLHTPDAVAQQSQSTQWPRPEKRDAFERAILDAMCDEINPPPMPVDVLGRAWCPARILAVHESAEHGYTVTVKVDLTGIALDSDDDTTILPISSSRLQPADSRTAPRITKSEAVAGAKVDVFCSECSEWHQAIIASVCAGHSSGDGNDDNDGNDGNDNGEHASASGDGRGDESVRCQLSPWDLFGDSDTDEGSDDSSDDSSDLFGDSDTDESSDGSSDYGHERFDRLLDRLAVEDSTNADADAKADAGDDDAEDEIKVNLACECTHAAFQGINYNSVALCAHHSYTGPSPTHQKVDNPRNVLHDLIEQAGLAGECLVVAARRWAGHESEHEASRCVEVDEYGSESEFDTDQESDETKSADSRQGSDSGIHDSTASGLQRRESAHGDAGGEGGVRDALRGAHPRAQQTADNITAAVTRLADALADNKGAISRATRHDDVAFAPVVKGGVFAKPPLETVVAGMQNVAKLKTAQAFMADVRGKYHAMHDVVAKLAAVIDNRATRASVVAQAQMKLCELKLALAESSASVVDVASSMRLDAASMQAECQRLAEEKQQLAPHLTATRELLEQVATETSTVAEVTEGGERWFDGCLASLREQRASQQRILREQRNDEARLLKAAMEANRALFMKVRERATTEKNIGALANKATAVATDKHEFLATMAKQKEQLAVAREETEVLEAVGSSMAGVLDASEQTVQALLARMPVDEQHTIEQAGRQAHADVLAAMLEVSKHGSRLQQQQNTLEERLNELDDRHRVAREFGMCPDSRKTAQQLQEEIGSMEAEIATRKEALSALKATQDKVNGVVKTLCSFAKSIPEHDAYADAPDRAAYIADDLRKRLISVDRDAARGVAEYKLQRIRDFQRIMEGRARRTQQMLRLAQAQEHELSAQLAVTDREPVPTLLDMPPDGSS